MINSVCTRSYETVELALTCSLAVRDGQSLDIGDLGNSESIFRPMGCCEIYGHPRLRLHVLLHHSVLLI